MDTFALNCVIGIYSNLECCLRGLLKLNYISFSIHNYHVPRISFPSFTSILITFPSTLGLMSVYRASLSQGFRYEKH